MEPYRVGTQIFEGDAQLAADGDHLPGSVGHDRLCAVRHLHPVHPLVPVRILRPSITAM